MLFPAVRILSVLLGLATALSGLQLQAGVACRLVHEPEVPGLYNRLQRQDLESEHYKNIGNLALKLLEEHLYRLKPGLRPEEVQPVGNWKVELIRVLNFQPEINPKVSRYLELRVVFIGVTKDLFDIRIRSNGSVAFISSSFNYRKNENVQKYKAAYFKNGKILMADQGELILSSIPEGPIMLSRSMQKAERLAWLEGKTLTFMYPNKVHFAPVYYKYTSEPYLIPFTKAELVEFYRSGELEINTYDAIGTNNPSKGMTMTELGLEFELVFVGQQAIEKIRPRMVENLRQQVLDF